MQANFRHPFALVALALLVPLAAPVSAQRGDVELKRVSRLEQAHRLSPAPPANMIRRADLRAGERPIIMLTGYWPPTNDMIRQFSDDPIQNPTGWVGLDWEGRGYDIYAYFPEFPDGGGLGGFGKGVGDLEVDYQDTSNDFWPLANNLTPLAVITFSRGNNDMSWEVEMNQHNKDNWIGDYLPPINPTPNPPDDSVPADFLRLSSLPLQDIVDAVAMLPFNIVPFICFTGDGGGFLSEFIAYHGVWYRSLHDQPSDPAWCAAAGHIHVGGQIPTNRARVAAETSIRAVIDTLDQIVPKVVCQVDLGFAGPGNTTLSVCGDALQSGGEVDVLLSGALPHSTAFLAFGLNNSPTAFLGGTLVPVPILKLMAFTTDAEGELLLRGVKGGGGPSTGYLQAIVADAHQASGYGLSNALELDFLP